MITSVNGDRDNADLQESPSHSPSATQQLRRALREFPGESGALGATWATRTEAERHATYFCEVACVGDVESTTGEYHARVFELSGERWGVVVWYG